jgi:hypothetical protein
MAFLVATMRTVGVSIASWTADTWSAIGSMTQAIATVFTLGVAIFAACYAARQVREARAQVDEARKAREFQADRAMRESEEQAKRDQQLREDQARPFVVVDFDASPVWGNIINLVFENVGRTLAKNVRFSFDPPLVSSQGGEGYDFESSVLLTQGIPAMPPGKRFEALFDLSHDRLKANLPMTYTVKVDSQDAYGRNQDTLEYILDLNFRYGIKRVESKTIHDVAKSLHAIERNIDRWTQHSNGLRVWLRDEKSYLKHLDELYEQRQARRHESTHSAEED